jgi:ATP-dependent protease HslVU (ClpYQ) peptidase subunit
MSVVAARKKNDKIEIAADSITVCGYTVMSAANNSSSTKIKRINNTVIAGCGLSEITSMLFLFAKTHLIKESTEDGIIDWMKDFMDWRREKTGKFGIEDNEFLIVFQNRIFKFHNYYCQEIDTFMAIGAGFEYALAALRLGHSPFNAVQVACDLSIYCRGPVVEV